MDKIYLKDGNSEEKGHKQEYCKQHFMEKYGREPNITDTCRVGFCVRCIIDKIKAAKTMEEMDNIRMDVVKAKTNESLQLWQKKYRGLKCFRKPADIGYKYKYL